MSGNWLERHRALTLGVLLAVVLAGVGLLIYRYAATPAGVPIMLTPPSRIEVYVTGAVAAPGVYELAADARLEEAVAAAEGFRDDADPEAVDLARKLRDGETVHIYKMGEVPQRVNINTADVWLLKALPGIDDVLAGRIVDWRNENGFFECVDDLKRVKGIGEATVDKLREKVTVR